MSLFCMKHGWAHAENGQLIKCKQVMITIVIGTNYCRLFMAKGIEN